MADEVPPADGLDPHETTQVSLMMDGSIYRIQLDPEQEADFREVLAPYLADAEQSTISNENVIHNPR